MQGAHEFGEQPRDHPEHHVPHLGPECQGLLVPAELPQSADQLGQHLRAQAQEVRGLPDRLGP